MSEKLCQCVDLPPRAGEGCGVPGAQVQDGPAPLRQLLPGAPEAEGQHQEAVRALRAAERRGESAHNLHHTMTQHHHIHRALLDTTNSESLTSLTEMT